jgi:hypothetical protein
LGEKDSGGVHPAFTGVTVTSDSRRANHSRFARRVAMKRSLIRVLPLVSLLAVPVGLLAQTTQTTTTSTSTMNNPSTGTTTTTKTKTKTKKKAAKKHHKKMTHHKATTTAPAAKPTPASK